MKKPPPRCKVAVVLIDGIGDVSVEELGGLTPLQAANTPYMDAIAGCIWIRNDRKNAL